MNPNEYRRDIDGLRAVAVASVLVHHLAPSILPGGYVGVDIFFVISGFLITSQIAGEIARQQFSFRQFYKRRINRILPALLTVLVASLLAGLFVLSPLDLVLLAKSAAAAFFGVSNILLWREYGNYFAGNASEAPLLHTWSLGVEEQFYLVWPVLLIVLMKLGRRHVVWLLVALTAGGAVFSEVAVGYFASASYYLLPTRFFELAVGGALAFLLSQAPRPAAPVALLCLIGGFVLIGGSVLLLSPASAFPGINALWPCLGSALVIFARKTEGLGAKLLTNTPIVFIGLISYSLYLCTGRQSYF